jgi:hypothetical protein
VPHVEFDCESCGKHVRKFIVPAILKIRTPRFCDAKCSGLGRRGENHPAYKHGKHIGRVVKNRPAMKPNVSFVCQVCGKHVEKYVIPSNQSSCTFQYCDRTCAGKGRMGERHPSWKEGRHVDKDGYIYVLCPQHPHANSKGYVPEHRLMMEEHIGRYLTPEEVVHHEDDDPGNNAIDNLRLFANQAEHKRYHERNRTRQADGRYAARA